MSHDENYMPVAVIGMAGRFPDAPDIEKYWKNIVEGRCSAKTHSAQTLRKRGVPDDYVNDDTYVGVTNPLRDIEFFDYEFFGFNRRDAEIMDPQFRQFFEVAWLALEDAGLAGRQREMNIGVMSSSGMSLYSDKYMNNYFNVNVRSHNNLMNNLDPIQAKVLTEREYLPTHLSYKLNLTGPSFPVNTACSSSLVAIHLATQSLAKGECDAVIVGGAAIHAPDLCGYFYNEGSIFSVDGVCRPFDKSANGIVGGNGVGVVVLTTLEDAKARGDRIYAVIKGSSINNDGALKVSYTAPSVDGQKHNVVRALNASKVDAAAIGLVEAHGTGTAMGDPIEVAALEQAFDQCGGSKEKIRIGSVKSNIGHLDTAAGIASFIKAVCAIYHGQKPGTANYAEPNTQLGLSKSCFKI